MVLLLSTLNKASILYFEPEAGRVRRPDRFVHLRIGSIYRGRSGMSGRTERLQGIFVLL